MMKKTMTLIILILLISIRVFAPADRAIYIQRTEPIKDQSLLLAIIQVESKGNPTLVNWKEQAMGLLQIRPIMIQEINRILKKRGINQSCTLTDALDSMKSIQMYWIVQNYLNPTNDLKKGCEVWNGKSKHNHYFELIKARL